MVEGNVSWTQTIYLSGVQSLVLTNASFSTCKVEGMKAELYIVQDQTQIRPCIPSYLLSQPLFSLSSFSFWNVP
jgi:hypothetical protein